MELKSNPNIAIVKLSSFGDIIHALPVLCALKKHFPMSQISWLVEAAYKDLVENHQGLADVIVVDTKSIRKVFTRPSKFDEVRGEIHALREIFKEKKFDIAIDIQGLIKSALVTFATGAKVRMGFSPGACRESIAALFYNSWVHPDLNTHIIEQNLTFIKKLGINDHEIKFNLHASEIEKILVKDLLKNKLVPGRPLVLMFPGTRWQTKGWQHENFVALISQLEKSGVNCLLAGGADEASVLREINAKVLERDVCVSGLDFKKLMALMECADIIMASDSGPLHLAGALGRKTVSFFGPTRPGRSGWFGENHEVFYPEIPCVGCYKTFCADLKCMKAIKVEEVFSSINRLLGKETSMNFNKNLLI